MRAGSETQATHGERARANISISRAATAQAPIPRRRGAGAAPRRGCGAAARVRRRGSRLRARIARAGCRTRCGSSVFRCAVGEVARSLCALRQPPRRRTRDAAMKSDSRGAVTRWCGVAARRAGAGGRRSAHKERATSALKQRSTELLTRVRQPARAIPARSRLPAPARRTTTRERSSRGADCPARHATRRPPATALTRRRRFASRSEQC